MDGTPLSSLKDLCLHALCDYLTPDIQLKGSVLMTYLIPEDFVTIADRLITKYGRRVHVCPLDLLLPNPAVLVLPPHIRTRLDSICKVAPRDNVTTAARRRKIESLLEGDVSSESEQLNQLMLLGRFFCEVGWYAEGLLILQTIFYSLQHKTSPRLTDIALDAIQKQLSVAVTQGRVQEVHRLVQLTRPLLVGRHAGPLLAATRICLARSYLLLERWKDALSELRAAVRCLRTPSLPLLDVTCDLAQVGARLALTLGSADMRGGMELALQAAVMAEQCWGEQHMRTIVAVELLADYTATAGFTTAAQDLLMRALNTSDVMFGPDSQLTSQVLIHLMLSRHGPTASDEQRTTWEQRLSAVNVPPDSTLAIDRILADALCIEERVYDASPAESEWRARSAMQQLTEADQRCDQLLGPSSLRHASILTEIGRVAFSFGLKGLHWPDSEADYFTISERALQKARRILTQLQLPRHHRARLLALTTTACLYTYSPFEFFQDAERMFAEVATTCNVLELRRLQHADLAEHSLRGLSAIYEQAGDTGRADAAQIQRQRVRALQARQQQRRLPATSPLSKQLSQPLQQLQLVSSVLQLLDRVERHWRGEAESTGGTAEGQQRGVVARPGTAEQVEGSEGTAEQVEGQGSEAAAGRQRTAEGTAEDQDVGQERGIPADGLAGVHGQAAPRDTDSGQERGIPADGLAGVHGQAAPRDADSGQERGIPGDGSAGVHGQAAPRDTDSGQES